MTAPPSFWNLHLSHQRQTLSCSISASSPPPIACSIRTYYFIMAIFRQVPNSHFYQYAIFSLPLYIFLFLSGPFPISVHAWFRPEITHISQLFNGFNRWKWGRNSHTNCCYIKHILRSTMTQLYFKVEKYLGTCCVSSACSNDHCYFSSWGYLVASEDSSHCVVECFDNDYWINCGHE